MLYVEKTILLSDVIKLVGHVFLHCFYSQSSVCNVLLTIVAICKVNTFSPPLLGVLLIMYLIDLQLNLFPRTLICVDLFIHCVNRVLLMRITVG